MQRRKARLQIVRVRARVHQGDGELEVGVLDGEQHRARARARRADVRARNLDGFFPPAQRLVDVDARRKERARDLDAPFAHGEEKRSKS